MKVFITGADGVLGNNLVRILLERSCDIRVFIEEGRKAAYLEELDVEKYYGSILDYNGLQEAVQGCDIIIHAAAKTDTWPPRHLDYWKVNLEGTRNIIAAAREAGVKRLLHIGTANSFGPGDEKNPGDETRPYASGRYKLDYMSSKYAAQELVLDAVEKGGLDAVVLNPTFMIGPYDAKPSSGTMILAVNDGRMPGYPPGGRNFVYVKDVAVAIANAMEKGKNGECYILGNENLSYKQAFGKMAAALDVKAPARKIPRLLTLAYGGLLSTASSLFRFTPSVTYPLALISTEKHYYTSKKAVNELDMPQTPLEEALREAVAWFRDHGYMNKK